MTRIIFGPQGSTKELGWAKMRNKNNLTKICQNFILEDFKKRIDLLILFEF